MQLAARRAMRPLHPIDLGYDFILYFYHTYVPHSTQFFNCNGTLSRTVKVVVPFIFRFH